MRRGFEIPKKMTKSLGKSTKYRNFLFMQQNRFSQTKQWYKVAMPLAHQGGKKILDTTNYVFARNPVEALEMCKKMPGVKKRNPLSVEPLTPEEVIAHEQRILQSRVSIKKAKEKGFFGTRFQQHRVCPRRRR